MAKRNPLASINMPFTSSKKAARYARRKSGASLAAGIATGVVVGAAAGLLLAPKSGKETREDIKNKGAEIVEQVKVKTAEVTEKIKDCFKKPDEVDELDALCATECCCDAEAEAE